MGKPVYDVSVENGKYRFVYFDDASAPEAYRHGERWLPMEALLLGNKAVLCLVARVAELEEQTAALIHNCSIQPLNTDGHNAYDALKKD